MKEVIVWDDEVLALIDNPNYKCRSEIGISSALSLSSRRVILQLKNTKQKKSSGGGGGSGGGRFKEFLITYSVGALGPCIMKMVDMQLPNPDVKKLEGKMHGEMHRIDEMQGKMVEFDMRLLKEEILQGRKTSSSPKGGPHISPRHLG